MNSMNRNNEEIVNNRYISTAKAKKIAERQQVNILNKITMIKVDKFS